MCYCIVKLLRNSGKKESELASKKEDVKKPSEGEGNEDDKNSQVGEEELERHADSATPTDPFLHHSLGAMSAVNAIVLEEKERELTEKEHEVLTCRC